jgi:hypothetical protein
MFGCSVSFLQLFSMVSHYSQSCGDFSGNGCWLLGFFLGGYDWRSTSSRLLHLYLKHMDHCKRTGRGTASLKYVQ